LAYLLNVAIVALVARVWAWSWGMLSIWSIISVQFEERRQLTFQHFAHISHA